MESYLSEGYDLCLIVEGMTVTKQFGCDHCGATIVASSPDDQYTILRVKSEGESLERKIVCENCRKENVRYWMKAGGKVILKTR